MVPLQAFRYFGGFSWFPCPSLQVFGIWCSCQSSGILGVNQAFGCFWDSRFESYLWFPFQSWGILRVTHGFLVSLQVFWELLMVSFPVLRYFESYSWFPFLPWGILGLLMVSFPVFRYFGSYSWFPFQSSGILGVTHGFLASLQVFWGS